MSDEHTHDEEKPQEQPAIVGSMVSIRNMSPELWTRYNWVNVQTHADPEPKYFCLGLRKIEDVERAAQEYAAFRSAWGF